MTGSLNLTEANILGAVFCQPSPVFERFRVLIMSIAVVSALLCASSASAGPLTVSGSAITLPDKDNLVLITSQFQPAPQTLFLLSWVTRYNTTGQISPSPLGGDRRSGRIEAQIRRTPDLTLLESQCKSRGWRWVNDCVKWKPPKPGDLIGDCIEKTWRCVQIVK